MIENGASPHAQVVKEHEHVVEVTRVKTRLERELSENGAVLAVFWHVMREKDYGRVPLYEIVGLLGGDRDADEVKQVLTDQGMRIVYAYEDQDWYKRKVADIAQMGETIAHLGPGQETEKAELEEKLEELKRKLEDIKAEAAADEDFSKPVLVMEHEVYVADEQRMQEWRRSVGKSDDDLRRLVIEHMTVVSEDKWRSVFE